MINHLSIYFIIRDYNKMNSKYRCRKQYNEFLNYYYKLIK